MSNNFAGHNTTKKMALCGMFAALMALLAQLSVPLPFSPVPLTGQVFGVLLAGLVLSPGISAMSMIVYILLGFIGIPVFHGLQGGPHILIGPTGGYILGFVPACYLIGIIAWKSDSVFRIASGLIVGLLIIYLLGAIQLSFVMGFSFMQAVYAGVLPYLPLDIVKAVMAGFIGLRLKKCL